MKGNNNTRSLVYSTQYMLREIPLMLCLLSPPHTDGKKSISRSCVALAKEQLQRNPMLFMCIYLSFASILYHVYVSMRQREKEKVDVWREKKSIRVVTRNTGF